MKERKDDVFIARIPSKLKTYYRKKAKTVGLSLSSYIVLLLIENMYEDKSS